MRRLLWKAGILMLSFILTACAALKPSEPVREPLQALVVTTSGWDRTDGVMQGYERMDGEKPWLQTGGRIPVVVGRRGMAWGTGLHPLPLPAGPVKVEGDGRAPAGIFKLSSAFGYQPVSDVAWLQMPYRQATAGLQCVDDFRSPYYNRIVDTARFPVVWNSHEEMRRNDELYRFGIVVDHNVNPVVPGAGSCIFLHIWRGPLQGTAGCTAMAAPMLERLLHWLKPEALPVLIQLPEQEYMLYRTAWRLP